MALIDDFNTAQVRVKSFKQTPGATDLLALYALYKQATVGDVSGGRPGMLDFKGRAKYDAWASKTAMPSEAAMREYVELVEQLSTQFG